MKTSSSDLAKKRLNQIESNTLNAICSFMSKLRGTMGHTKAWICKSNANHCVNCSDMTCSCFYSGSMKKLKYNSYCPSDIFENGKIAVNTNINSVEHRLSTFPIGKGLWSNFPIDDFESPGIVIIVDVANLEVTVNCYDYRKDTVSWNSESSSFDTSWQDGKYHKFFQSAHENMKELRERLIQIANKDSHYLLDKRSIKKFLTKEELMKCSGMFALKNLGL